MATVDSETQAGVKELEVMLLGSHTRSDLDLLKEEGRKLQDLMPSLAQLDKDAKRKIMGPVVTLFCSEYADARKAIRAGLAAEEFKFERGWELAAKGKQRERPTKPPTMDLSKMTKPPPKKGKREPGPSKPAADQSPPPAESPPAQTTKPATKKNPQTTAGATSKKAAPPLPPAQQQTEGPAKPPTKITAPPKPPTKAPAAPKPPTRAVAQKAPSAAKPPKAPKRPAASASKSTAKGPEDMDVDEDGGESPAETPSATKAGGKAARKRGVSDKVRREQGEAAYNPDEDSQATDYADERVPPAGGKRKAQESKQKGGPKKKAKSAPIVPTDSEPDVPPHPATKTTAAKSGPAKAKETGPQPRMGPPHDAITRTIGARSTTPIAVRAARAKPPKAPKPGAKVKLRSNYRKHLCTDILELLDNMAGLRITEEQEAAYKRWTNRLAKTDPSMRPKNKLRANTPATVVLLGDTLDPVVGTKKTDVTCDWCVNFAPMRCMVIDEGTACLMCNLFLKKGCTVDGEPAMQYRGGPRKNPDKARSQAKKSGGRANSGGNTSQQAPVDAPADDHNPIDELHAVQARHAAAIRAIQSQMDTMTLGMAACGSLLKNAKEEVAYQTAHAEDLGGKVDHESQTLAGAIALLEAGRDSALPTEPSAITHEMIRTHLDNMEQLIQAGVRFSQVFTTLATDVTNTTKVLSEWLLKGGDVVMNNPEDDDDEDEDSDDEDIPVGEGDDDDEDLNDGGYSSDSDSDGGALSALYF